MTAPLASVADDVLDLQDPCDPMEQAALDPPLAVGE